MTTPQPRTGKGDRGGRTGGRGSATGTSTGTAIKAPLIFRRSPSHRITTGKLGRWAKPNAGPYKPPRRVAAMVAHQQGGSAEARALRRLKQPVRVRMERGEGQRVRVRISGGMSQEQRNDYYAACEGKISWAQYRARWGHGPQLG